MDPATLAQIAATHPLVRTVESGEEPTGPAAEAIRRQVESLLAIDMEDPELHEAMDVVADLWKSKGMGNTAENRRNLRSDLERQAVERCEDFVRQMAPMRDMLRQAEANADLLDKQAQESVEDLERTDAETRRVVAAHEQLLATRDQLQSTLDGEQAVMLRQLEASMPDLERQKALRHHLSGKVRLPAITTHHLCTQGILRAFASSTVHARTHERLGWSLSRQHSHLS